MKCASNFTFGVLILRRYRNVHVGNYTNYSSGIYKYNFINDSRGVLQINNAGQRYGCDYIYIYIYIYMRNVYKYDTKHTSHI